MVTLRDVVEDDLPIFFEHQREPEANEMAAFPARDRDAFMTHWRTKVLANPNARTKTIVVDGCVVGNVVSWEQEGKRLVGYWVGRAHWGKGVATAALADFVTNHETVRPTYAFVASQNVGSIRVLDKCGFQRVGDPVKGHDGVEELLMRLDCPALASRAARFLNSSAAPPRPSFIKHWKEIVEPDNARYPGSDELLSIGSPLGRATGLTRINTHHPDRPTEGSA